MVLAAARGWACGFVTFTERANIDAILARGGAIATEVQSGGRSSIRSSRRLVADAEAFDFVEELAELGGPMPRVAFGPGLDQE